MSGIDRDGVGGATRAGERVTWLGAVRTFWRVGTCSEAIMNVVDRGFGEPLVREEIAVAPLAGGIMAHGYQCGMLWGAALAAGARAYALFGGGPRAEERAVRAAQRVVSAFRSQARSINCLEITELDWMHARRTQVVKFFVKGGPVGCFHMAGRYGPMVRREIDAAMAEPEVDVPAAPVSCAAELARKMGASEMHAAMAAGCAGGIGLCGGACGALGAAIWLRGITDEVARPKGLGSDDPRRRSLVDRLLKQTDYTFECEKIVGRRFDDLADHAAYLREGGCGKVLDALAAGSGA